MHFNFSPSLFYFICNRVYDVIPALHSGWGGVRLCAALRGVVEAKDAGSRRVHPLPRPCSQLGG